MQIPVRSSVFNTVIPLWYNAFIYFRFTNHKCPLFFRFISVLLTISIYLWMFLFECIWFFFNVGSEYDWFENTHVAQDGEEEDTTFFELFLVQRDVRNWNRSINSQSMVSKCTCFIKNMEKLFYEFISIKRSA